MRVTQRLCMEFLWESTIPSTALTKPAHKCTLQHYLQQQQTENNPNRLNRWTDRQNPCNGKLFSHQKGPSWYGDPFLQFQDLGRGGRIWICGQLPVAGGKGARGTGKWVLIGLRFPLGENRTLESDGGDSCMPLLKENYSIDYLTKWVNFVVYWLSLNKNWRKLCLVLPVYWE